ncbi:MAG TPA: ATP-grasp domain-containing protein, partial [Ignavibacteriaceae bacterium]|nr:ATP-grasp domain-containing protein [Ignavibacteriaceae bacterium]
MQQLFEGENILSSLVNAKLNVALTFNVKPVGIHGNSESSSEILSPVPNASSIQSTENKTQPGKAIDTYAEWDTWDTINAVKSALECFNPVTLIEADQSAYKKLIDLKPDIVFNIAEGFNGVSREAQIPSMLDMLGIPYTGSDPLTLTTCLDKARTKEVLSYYRIPNSRFILTNDLNHADNLSLKFPLIVKPVSEGSSKGIFSSSFVRNYEELKNEVERISVEYSQPALIEEFLPGREFTVALLGNGDETEVLPVIEINYEEFPDNFIPIYSYEAKWIFDTKENPLDVFTCPAKIDHGLENKIKSVALKTYQVLRCKDWSRIDIRLDGKGEPNIIEVNPLPGI